MTKTELKENITKTKKLLKQRDYDAIDTGIEQARALDEPAVFEALLGGCSINDEGILVLEEDYKGETLTKRWSSETRPFFKYALFNLIIYAPQDIDADASIERKNISSLYLSSNSFPSIPPEIGQLTELTSLDLYYNSLSSIPPEIGQLKSLTSLVLRGNSLSSIPPEIGLLQSLTSLDLSSNSLSSILPEIGQLKSLTSLDLSSNSLSSIPPEIGQLTELTSLDLSSNSLSSIPPEIGQLKSLTSFNLCNNSLSSIPADIGQLTRLTNLTSLDLSSNSLSSIPPDIGKMKKLTSLDLSGNNLTSLPPDLFSLKKTSINLADYLDNENDTVDKWIKTLHPEHFSILLKNYTHEDGRFVKDYEAAGFSNLSNELLIKLAASCPEERKIDDSLKPDNITSFDFETWPGLSQIPPEIGQFKNLRSINLKNCNDLSAIPVEISQLKMLNYLDLQGCGNIKPVPKPSKMDTRERVAKYQAKLLTDAGKEVPGYLQEKKKIPVDRKTLANIKKFLKKRDYGNIDTGIELVRSLDEPSIFETLLDNCAIDNEGKFARSNFFTGTGPAQAYLDYGLLNLIAYAPEHTELDESLKRPNIKSLSFSDLAWTELPSCIACLKNLTSLDLGGYLTTLNSGSCDSLQNVDVLAGLTNLTSLDISYCTSLQNVDSLANFTNLTTLNLSSCSSLQNVDGLANLPNLTSLDLSYCNKVQPKPSIGKMTTREEVAAYQEEIKKSMK